MVISSVVLAVCVAVVEELVEPLFKLSCSTVVTVSEAVTVLLSVTV